MSVKKRVLSALAVLGVAGGLVTVAGVSGVTAAQRADEVTPAELGLAAKAARANPDRQAELVTGEDRRVTQALVGVQDRKEKKVKGPYRVRPNGQQTLILTARKRPYSWDDLRRLSAEKLIPQADGSFLLREHVLVGPGATLSISPSSPLKLKLSSGPEGFVSIITDGGRIRLNGSETAPISIQSWDESHGKPDLKLSDGRAYVRSSGQMVVTNTKFSRLGFWSGRTGGVAVVSSSALPTTGLSVNAATGEIDQPEAERGNSSTDILPAGKLPASTEDESGSFASSIRNSTMTGNAFGLFISGSSGPQVIDTVISKSLVDGLVLHRNVDAATITGVTVQQSAVDGVVINRNVEGTVLTRLDVRNNGRDGVVLTGNALADGPSPSGASVRAFGNNVLSTSKSTGNGRIGVHVAGGVSITVMGNTVSGGHSGIVVSDRARDVTVNSNTVKDTLVNGIQVRDDSKAELTSNNVIGAATGVHVRDAVAALRDNSTSGVTLHAFTFVGAVAGSVAEDNQLRGSGTSAIDTVRVSGEQPELLTTDDSGWSRTVTKDSLLSILLHPLTMVWIGIGLLLLLMSRPRRGGTQTPYRADPLLGKGGPLQPLGDHPQVAGSARERENPVHTYSNQPEPVLAQQLLGPAGHPDDRRPGREHRPMREPARGHEPSRLRETRPPARDWRPTRPVASEGVVALDDEWSRRGNENFELRDESLRRMREGSGRGDEPLRRGSDSLRPESRVSGNEDGGFGRGVSVPGSADGAYGREGSVPGTGDETFGHSASVPATGDEAFVRGGLVSGLGGETPERGGDGSGRPDESSGRRDEGVRQQGEGIRRRSEAPGRGGQERGDGTSRRGGQGRGDETPRRTVSTLQPRRSQQRRPAGPTQPGFVEYSDPEPPVAAEWRQPQGQHSSVSLPRQKPEVQIDVRDRTDVRANPGVPNTNPSRTNGVHGQQSDAWEAPDPDDQRRSGELTPAAGSTMIDLAIAEARLNPTPARRRRVVGR